MIKLSRLTDYGVVVMAQIDRSGSDVTTAHDLARATGLPSPTVSKLLKKLSKTNLLMSHRGVHGGYSLSRPLEKITVAELIEALDGPVALTACVGDTEDKCKVESLCPVRGGWDRLNRAVRAALEEMSLADLCMPIEFPEITAPKHSNSLRREHV
ncbi:MAG: SUF system Fe-S cluster assembly regulator [Rhodospirillaceae bacterium]|nr:SUF system Fe-S cluster assembly regulator [Rhodospirillaceae bacterium]MBL25394.1 SUF system Fe-S cluster assembly regulator [Rhodospirillaceae bacterium]HAA92657.1 SUF system Fe-S cluster assembly regulator [Rhodospirillaceae bacterium]|tara:strand:- start:280 stop:744 length:465 start_codon:yes stop_codon:yes gene_type:complete